MPGRAPAIIARTRARPGAHTRARPHPYAPAARPYAPPAP
ncbi:hypothetical protein GA0115257_10551, partial [Streptomyces sp. LcepLS]